MGLDYGDTLQIITSDFLTFLTVLLPTESAFGVRYKVFGLWEGDLLF